MIIGHGMVAFRDPNGIRPLVLGKRDIDENRTEYMVASESVALDTLGFDFLRDVARAKRFTSLKKGSCLPVNVLTIRSAIRACLSMYTLLARLVHRQNFRLQRACEYGHEAGRENCPRMGRSGYRRGDPDPETSCDIALEIARILGKPYRQGFVKNRYVGRTFIMRVSNCVVSPCAVS